MTDVQLSTSTLERLVARRTFPLHARTSVCRNLFGPVDHDEVNREMKSKLREISERDQRRWNFNFETDTPLPGEYQWEETTAETSPAFYQESVQIGRTRVVIPVQPCAVASSADTTSVVDGHARYEERTTVSEGSLPCPSEVNQENCADKLNSGRPTCLPTPCARRKRTTELTTTQITDFFVKRRRTTSVKQGESVCQHSPTAIPVEQTPRKRIR